MDPKASINCAYCSSNMQYKGDVFICKCGGEFDGIDRFNHPIKPTIFKREGGKTVSTLNKGTGQWEYEFTYR